MPKVIFNHHSFGTQLKSGSPDHLALVGNVIRQLVADAVSTDYMKLTPADVDWVPVRYMQGTLAPAYSIEIETIGYPERKKKLTFEVLLGLKRAILALPGFEDFDQRFPLIWVKYVDPDGQHL